MPVEIREIIIKTEIFVNEGNRTPVLKEKELNLIKSQLLDEFKRMLNAQNKRKNYKR